MSQKYVGFVVDGMVPSFESVLAGKCGIRGYLSGRLSGSAVAIMRCSWIAAEVNRIQREVRYEFYRPWRGYDAVVFVKSMGGGPAGLARRLKGKGVAILFDANVDYFSEPQGREYYQGMFPDAVQRADAQEMLALADGVIADSEFIASKCSAINGTVMWIPDNVNMGLLPDVKETSVFDKAGRLKLLWCGESVKMFDLLEVQEILSALSGRVLLRIITNDRSAGKRWAPDIRSRFDDMISALQVEYVDYAGVQQLLSQYSEGGVFISPRMLDNNYNLGHTEWKITLPMSCGITVLCSPVPSYITVSERSSGKCVRICRTKNDWRLAIEDIFEGKWGRGISGDAADVVRKYYSTEVVARSHLDFVMRVMDGVGQ